MKKELNNKIWKDEETLDKKVRSNLLQITKDFIKFVKIKNLKINDIILTGSIANYTWHDQSDIDVHIIFDLKNFERHRNFIKEFLQTKKAVWNNAHDIKMKGFKVEVYPEDEADNQKNPGMFSLVKNKWIEKPSQIDDTEVDKAYVRKKYQSKVDQILDIEEKAKDKKNYKIAISNIEAFVENLRSGRKAGLKAHGELAPENLVFKMLRNNGYIEKIAELKKKVYDKALTVKEIK